MFRAIFEAIGPRGEISASIEFHRLSYPLARVWKCAVREFIERNECEISVAWIEKSNFLSRIWNQPSNPPCLSFPAPPRPPPITGRIPATDSRGEGGKITFHLSSFWTWAVIDRSPIVYHFFLNRISCPRVDNVVETWTSPGANEFHFSLPFLISRGIQWKTRFCRKKEGESGHRGGWLRWRRKSFSTGVWKRSESGIRSSVDSGDLYEILWDKRGLTSLSVWRGGAEIGQVFPPKIMEPAAAAPPHISTLYPRLVPFPTFPEI